MDPTDKNMNHESQNNAYDKDALLTAYALGELEGDELAQAEALIASDPAAKAEVEDIRRVAGQLSEALAAEGSTQAGLTDAQKQAIDTKADEAGAAGEAPPPVYRFRRQWIYWGAGSAVAAMLVVAIMLPALGEPRRSVRRMVHNLPDVARMEKDSRRAYRDQSLLEDRESTLRYRDENARQDTAAAGQASSNESRQQMSGKLAEGKETVVTDQLMAVKPTAPPSASEPQTEWNFAGRERKASDKDASASSRFGSQPAELAQQQVGQALALSRSVAAEAPMTIAPQPPADAALPGRFNPNFHTEAYDKITDNPYLNVSDNPLSTFSIDVDTASYANIRRFLNQGQLPPAGAVRIEEMVNYFPYTYSGPADDKPFAVHVETGSAPWAHEHRLVKIGLKGKDIVQENKPVTNLVFLIDVSGSMMQANKLPLLKEGMKLLVKQMDEKDHVAIVVYAGAAGMVLDSTPGTAEGKDKITAAIENLRGGGSTNGGAGIRLAYDLATKHFNKEGVNRVILASDGDFNVGTTSQSELISLIEDKRKTGVFLTTLGFGQGNYKDTTMEQLANKGNGNHAYIDSLDEAKKVLVEQAAGTLYTIAKDVKIQVEFNPAKVQSYRLIGYENRLLAKEDFNDDTKDAGEIGAGHTVTALYEVVPVGVKNPVVPPVDALKYQPEANAASKPAAEADRATNVSNELLTVKLRYKQPDGDVSTRMDVPVVDAGKPWHDASEDYKFAAAVAQFGMLLRNSPYKGESDYAQVLDLAQSGLGADEKGYRSQMIELVEKARAITNQQKEQ